MSSSSNTSVTGEQLHGLCPTRAQMDLPDKHREVPNVPVQSPELPLASPLLRPELTPGIFLLFTLLVCSAQSTAMPIHLSAPVVQVCVAENT